MDLHQHNNFTVCLTDRPVTVNVHLEKISSRALTLYNMFKKERPCLFIIFLRSR